MKRNHKGMCKSTLALKPIRGPLLYKGPSILRCKKRRYLLMDFMTSDCQTRDVLSKTLLATILDVGDQQFATTTTGRVHPVFPIKNMSVQPANFLQGQIKHIQELLEKKQHNCCNRASGGLEPNAKNWSREVFL